jgi:hypothetical protein
MSKAKSSNQDSQAAPPPVVVVEDLETAAQTSPADLGTSEACSPAAESAQQAEPQPPAYQTSPASEMPSSFPNETTRYGAGNGEGEAFTGIHDGFGYIGGVMIGKQKQFDGDVVGFGREPFVDGPLIVTPFDEPSMLSLDDEREIADRGASIEAHGSWVLFVAARLYEALVESVGFKDKFGTPNWFELSDEMRSGWEASARKAIEILTPVENAYQGAATRGPAVTTNKPAEHRSGEEARAMMKAQRQAAKAAKPNG